MLAIANEVIPEFKLHILNAHGDGIPDREGVTYETAFVCPAMCNHPRLGYTPSRLSLLPLLIRNFYRPDTVLLALKKRKGLHIWTEIFSDGVLELSKAAYPSVREELTAKAAEYGVL